MMPNRVVDRGPEYGARRWDVFNDEIGDYIATMLPALPVSKRKVAQRICDSLNAKAQNQPNNPS